MQLTLVQSQCDQEDLPGGGPGNPLQYSCLENPMDRGAWRFRVRVGHDESNWSHTHPHKPTQTSVSSQAWPHPFPTCVDTAALLEFLFQLPGCTMLPPSGQECQCPTPTTPPLHLRSLLFIRRSKGHFFKLSPVPLLHMSCYEASFPSSPFSVHTSACMMNECLSPPLSRRLREDRDPLLTLPSQLAQKGHFTDTCCIKKGSWQSKESEKDDTLKHLRSQWGKANKFSRQNTAFPMFWVLSKFSPTGPLKQNIVWICRQYLYVDIIIYFKLLSLKVSFNIGLCAHAVTSVMSDSLWPYGLQSARLLCQWNSPGRNTKVGFHASSQPGDQTHICMHLLHCT